MTGTRRPRGIASRSVSIGDASGIGTAWRIRPPLYLQSEEWRTKIVITGAVPIAPPKLND